MLLKILSYNIHKGFDWNNQNYSLDKMKELIRSTRADVVFLQEVVGKNDHYQKKGLKDAQFEYLADELWPHFSYAQNALYDHGHHGNLILSKYPIEHLDNVNLSTNRWEKRGLLVCKISIPPGENNPFEKKIVAACLHLNLLHSGRRIQYEKIKEYLTKETLPLIVAGDFNDWNKKSFQIFEDVLQMQEVHKSLNGNYAKTFPAHYPLFCLDRVYIKDLKAMRSEVLKTDTHFSDHLPLFCEVEI